MSLFHEKAGYLNINQPVKVKISGDGARMTRLTGFVLLSFAILEKKDEILSSRGRKKFLMGTYSWYYMYMRMYLILFNTWFNSFILFIYK